MCVCVCCAHEIIFFSMAWKFIVWERGQFAFILYTVCIAKRCYPKETTADVQDVLFGYQMTVPVLKFTIFHCVSTTYERKIAKMIVCRVVQDDFLFGTHLSCKWIFSPFVVIIVVVIALFCCWYISRIDSKYTNNRSGMMTGGDETYNRVWVRYRGNGKNTNWRP